MRTRPRTSFARSLVLLLLLLEQAGGTAAAQAPASHASPLRTILVPGHTVWLTDATGRETKSVVIGVADGTVTLGDRLASTRSLRLEEVWRVRVRENDSLLNGAFIGAAGAVTGGLFMCALTEPWANCRDDVGPMLRFGGLGAAAGVAIDAMLRSRRTVYDRSPRLEAGPLTGRGGLGARVALRFK